MLNGTDEISLTAFEYIKLGVGTKEIVDKLNISTDQAKKLSQLSKLYTQIYELPDELQDRFKKLGFKALVLLPLIKNNDMEGLKEILESIDPANVKRDALKMLLLAISEKRKRIEQLKKEADFKLEELEENEKETEQQIQELERNREKVDESLQFLSNVHSTEAKEFLLEHLGVTQGKLVLYQRLDISWQNSLKRKGVIMYNDTTYTWEIKDVDELARQVERRIKNKNNMYYNPDKAKGIYSDYYPDDPVYKNATDLGYSILEDIRHSQEKIKELKKKKSEIKKSIKDLKSAKLQSFIEAAEVSNHLSQKEILEHRKLQDAGMKYLYNQEYVAVTEVAKDKYRFDVVGYNETGEISISEAKASIEDFRADEKFEKYLQFCNRMYIVVRESLYNIFKNEIDNRIKPYGIGVITVGGHKVEKVTVVLEAEYKDMERTMKGELIFTINRTLCRKFIYGR